MVTIIVASEKDDAELWRDEWPVVPRTGETVVIKGTECEVTDVTHNFRTREIRVWVRVPLGVTI